MKTEFRLHDRREFFGNTLKGAALITAILQGRSAAAAEKPTANPFAYDVSRLEKTDPKLIGYEQAAKWRAPREEPKAIAAAPDGQLWLAAGNYVTAMSPEGQRGIEIALSAPARAVSIARDGTVFVSLRDHLEVFSAKGERKATWEAPDKKAWLTGIAVGDNAVFATDAGNRVLLRYDRAGKLTARLGLKDKDRNIAGFIVPSPYFDVALGGDGVLRVTNPGRHRVDLFTQDGDFELSWGEATMGIKGFCGCCNPIHLALLPDGRVVTCEKGLPRVKVYSAHGDFETVVAGPESFPENAKACAAKGLGDCTQGGLDAAVLADGRIAILDFVTGDVRVMKAKT
jgi:hypothetical protein